MSRRLILILPLSLVLHAAALAAALTLIPHEAGVSTLFIDLTLADLSAVAPPPSPDLRPRVRAVLPRAAPMADSVGKRAPSPIAPTTPVTPEAIRPPSVETAGEPSQQSADVSIDASGRPSPPAPVKTETAADADARADATAERHQAGTVVSASGPGASNGASPSDTVSAGDSGRGRGSEVAVASGTGDVPGAEYGPYLAGVRRQIAESLRYPLAARRRRLTGTVQLEIVIQANGAIGAADVVQSSTHSILDEAALETVKGLPRMPFPPDVSPRKLRVRLPVVFTLE